MLDLSAVFATLDAEGLGDWASNLEPLITERMADRAHGNLRDWRDALNSLPEVGRQHPDLETAAVGSASFDLNDGERAAVRAALLKLSPWRKGPFRIGDLLIDSEWRSNLKWDRIEPAMSPLTDRLVLDVGCGNGYYAMRMKGAGARAVIGIDPTLVYVLQFQALCRFFDLLAVHVLPLRLADLPPRPRAFDTVFSMGVLYHQRSPLDHLRQLRETLRPGGELVLETLILPGDTAFSRTPEDRYARMRNVWHLPSAPELLVWLRRAGFIDAAVTNRTPTTSDEQRSTEWMAFESLADALDAKNPTRTVEDWPAPLRAVLVCRTPG